MSKSLGNYIGVTDAPSDMFGKIMSISDELMWDWYNLLSFRPLTEIAELLHILNSADRLMEVIREELEAVKSRLW